MQKIVPFLWFDDQAEEAVNLYTSIFQGGKIGAIARYGENTPGPAGKVMTVAFELVGQEFVALNGGPVFQFSPAVSFFVSCQDEEQVEGLWKKLSEGGTVLMDLDQYPFSEKYGWLMDRYGVPWQLILSRTPQKISPCFLFVGSQHGKAEEAIHSYLSVFENSSINLIERYTAGEGDAEGTIKHARFTLHGQEFIAMESGLDHQFTFTPAISFFVNCGDQAEVDYFWEKLSHEGETERCGWLKDKYGISWQIVPTILAKLMSDSDEAKASRVTQALLKMTKIDVELLQKAYDQA